MDRPICGTCAYWVNKKQGVRGFCTRHPPQIREDGGGLGVSDIWPRTHLDESCGEHHLFFIYLEELARAQRV